MPSRGRVHSHTVYLTHCEAGNAGRRSRHDSPFARGRSSENDGQKSKVVEILRELHGASILYTFPVESASSTSVNDVKRP